MMTHRTKTALFWVAVIILFFLFLAEVQAILLPFVLGLMMAYLLDPVVDRLQHKGLGRTTSTAIITIGFFLSTGLLLVTLIPLIGEQLFNLLNELPDYVRSFSQKYSYYAKRVLTQLPNADNRDIQNAIADMSGAIMGLLAQVMQNVFASGAVALNILSLLLITPVVAFYLLRDWDNTTTAIDRLLPRTYAPTIREQLREIDRTLHGFLRGQLTVCTILALFYVVMLSLLGLKFSLIIGSLTGLLIIIPYVGWAAGATLAMIIAFMQYESVIMIMAVAATLLVGQALESYYLTPKLVGSSVGLHPLWLIFGMLAGGALFGFVGVLIAVPVTAVLGVLIRFAIAKYLDSSLYKGKP